VLERGEEKDRDEMKVGWEEGFACNLKGKSKGGVTQGKKD